RYSLNGGVATIALDRPEVRNAVNLEMCEALLAATGRAATEEARLVFVRGNGPVFCGGADLKERQGKGEQWIRERRLKAFAAAAADIATAILKATPLALRLAKRAIDRGIERDPQGAREAEIEAIDEQLAAGQWMGKA